MVLFPSRVTYVRPGLAIMYSPESGVIGYGALGLLNKHVRY